ncbi:MAG: hypothetical protein AAB401_19880, partial [Acidobacteriota bacterium]
MPDFTSIMKTKNLPSSSNAPRMNVVAGAMIGAPFLLGLGLTIFTLNPIGVIAGTLLGLASARAPRVAKHWERAVVLRLGRYIGLRGPG